LFSLWIHWGVYMSSLIPLSFFWIEISSTLLSFKSFTVGFLLFLFFVFRCYVGLFFSYFLCFCIETCSFQIKSLTGNINHRKSFSWITLYILAGLGSNRLDLPFLITGPRLYFWFLVGVLNPSSWDQSYICLLVVL
jgi:hypothetical protein